MTSYIVVEPNIADTYMQNSLQDARTWEMTGAANRRCYARCRTYITSMLIDNDRNIKYFKFSSKY
ncbi:hypothetical protein CHS0354_033108 [Potamilus streckersoni]|uniref:Uncharacterized protein n=1 Tax=Potamilus streckersoni TaxID=2493646 RepID=A0AAE0VQ89_9BIVA|nr:hypothetical protein CHS0354_033108 [Potamilus streckersoni]